MPTGLVVLVTGGSSGIGAAAARALTDAGNQVFALSRDHGAIVRAAGGRQIEPIAVDVLDGAAVAEAVARIVATHGRLDAVIHAAQVMAYGRIEDVPAEVFERVVDTAIHGTANVARVVLPQFRKQGDGTFVIINSLLGEIATPLMGAYDIGKWGQLGLARILRLEVHDAPGIHVCTVAPGAVNTPIYDQAANYAGRGGYPPPPVISPEKVAAKAIRLLDHPRRHVNAGPVNTLTLLGFRFFPGVYERIVGPLVRRFVFRGAASAGNTGNVLTAHPAGEATHGRWSVSGRPRRR